MNKVFVVIIDDVLDYESAITVEVFDTFDKALAYKKDIVDKHKKTSEWADEESVEENDDMYYSHYLEGYYSSDHFDVMIREREVQ